MTGDWSVDVPTYDAVFAAFAKQWPRLPEETKVCTLMAAQVDNLSYPWTHADPS